MTGTAVRTEEENDGVRYKQYLQNIMKILHVCTLMAELLPHQV